MEAGTWYDRQRTISYFRGVNVDQIIIKDLVARGIIGVNDSEREKPQEILINIVLMADLHKAGESDDITDTVNYRTVAKKAIAHAEAAQRFTVEALAADIAASAWKSPLSAGPGAGRKTGRGALC
jgi:FolB domain-containing protein